MALIFQQEVGPHHVHCTKSLNIRDIPDKSALPDMKCDSVLLCFSQLYWLFIYGS